MQILGIDPGYGTTGFALVEAHRGLHQLRQCGVITTPPGMDFPKRLETLYLDMDQLLKSALPEALAIEELFFGHNVTTGIGVAQARGIILLAASQRDIPVFEYKPMQVKQAVVGYGGASKHQVMDMTRRILKLEKLPRPDDAADAIAIALCHARSATSLLSQAASAAGRESLDFCEVFYVLLFTRSHCHSGARHGRGGLWRCRLCLLCYRLYRRTAEAQSDRPALYSRKYSGRRI